MAPGRYVCTTSRSWNGSGLAACSWRSVVLPRSVTSATEYAWLNASANGGLHVRRNRAGRGQPDDAMKLRFLVPILVLVVLVVFFSLGLTRNPRQVPSPLIDQPAPAFQAALLHDPTSQFSARDMRGQVWLLNVWASWCVACKREHRILLELARSERIPLYGLDYEDSREAGQRWLTRAGNPYIASAVDPDGEIGMNFGVYGVPETYLIDKQ